MSDQNLDYAAIRRNVEKSIRQQKRLYRMIFFCTHLTLFLLSMLAVWGTLVFDTQLRAVLFNSTLSAALIVVLPTILWAVTILCHGAAFFVESDAGEKQMREQLLMREIGEDILRQGLTNERMLEKPKRRAAALEAERVLLSDDGELILADEDEHPEQHSTNTRNNSVGDA